ncbi:hypothetical protein FOZ60_001921 [Perkinsus olseni]|uniref:Uncharacterized protein n=1 Tax=Perkinsus olseni TaxID=32597 RepID=A0A7J6NZJ7_PEROL|nr:hypothetical protein FOZ60_001921 [Perkinsus olseni]
MLRIVIVETLALASALRIPTSGVSELKEGTVAEDGKCRLDFGANQQINITFGDRSPHLQTPILSTSYIDAEIAPMPCRTTYSQDFSYLHIEYSFHDIRITHDQEARQHFSSTLPFKHLIGTPVMTVLRTYLPITSGDQEKCKKIFALLADHPPDGFERGIEWFGRFHRVTENGMWTLLSSWREKKRKQESQRMRSS